MLDTATMIFAVVFFIVGCFRIVEFKAAGVSLGQRRFLVPLHILGCFCFAGALFLLGYDAAQTQKLGIQILFAAGVLILFPLHIYVAVKRRIRISK